MSEYQKINLEFLNEGSVANIILNDGKGNVLDFIMMEDLLKALNSFQEMPDLKLIVFEGNGKHFSFGASVEEHRKDTAEAMLRSFHEIFFTISKLSIPTIARISGQCLGGGMELAIMCNVLFADKTAKLGQPEITLGVFPPPASVLLPLKLGYARAEELLLTGRTITAEEAQSYGLIFKVFEDKAEMNVETEKWIQEYILPRSASSLRYAVKAGRIKFNHIMGNFLPHLQDLYVKKLMETEDANEGIESFLEKRSPVWQNK